MNENQQDPSEVQAAIDTPLRTDMDGRALLRIEDPGTKTLDSLIGQMKRRRLDLSRCLRILIDLAESVAQMHAKRACSADYIPGAVINRGSGLHVCASHTQEIAAGVSCESVAVRRSD